MLTIDGSAGEGGGQILRSSLGLSLVTGRPFRIEKIRASRKRPGLLRQHLTAVEAAAAIGQARVEGAELRSGALTFEPAAVAPGEHRFNIGSAGSSTLVLQAVLPALLTADGPSTIVVEGGTHNPMAPPFDFLERAFLPLVSRMGPRFALTLERYGFYPAGGGRIRLTVEPAPRLRRLELHHRGELRRVSARAVVADLPPGIAERELQRICGQLKLPRDEQQLEQAPAGSGPGNVALVLVESEALTEVFTGFGKRGVRAEQVAAGVAREAKRYLAASAPVGRHLADQLLLPMALAGGGSFCTPAPSPHALTNIEVIGRFLEVAIRVREGEGGAWWIEVG